MASATAVFKCPFAAALAALETETIRAQSHPFSVAPFAGNVVSARRKTIFSLLIQCEDMQLTASNGSVCTSKVGGAGRKGRPNDSKPRPISGRDISNTVSLPGPPTATSAKPADVRRSRTDMYRSSRAGCEASHARSGRRPPGGTAHEAAGRCLPRRV